MSSNCVKCNLIKSLSPCCTIGQGLVTSKHSAAAVFHSCYQELMSRRRSMKLTQPAGCHDNPNQSPVSFHIRKVQSRYLKPYTKLRVTIFVTFKKMVGVLRVQAGVQ